MKRFLIFTILGLTVLAVKAQPPQIINPSPNMASFTSLINAGVGYYTGTPQINLPLLSLPTTQGSIPITLAYNSAGIKVADEASIVGLGWNLMGGGQITRVARGREDVYSTTPGDYGYDETSGKDSYYEQYDSAYIVSNNPPDFRESRAWKYVEDCIGGHCEPDIFFMTAPGLGTIKFTLNKKFNPVLLPYRKIKFEQDGIRNNGWIIIDENGTRYKFGYKANRGNVDFTEKSTVTTFDDYGTPTTNSFISTWYLEKITYPTGEAIRFNYTGIYGSITNEYTSHYMRMESNVIKETKSSTLQVIVEPKYLVNITSNYGQLNFSYSGSRKDISNGVKLDKVMLKNRSFQLVSEISMNYDYFDANKAYQTHNEVNNWTTYSLGNNGTEFFRLKLVGVSKNTNGIEKNLWDFEYLSGYDYNTNSIIDLPPKSYNITHTDKYGYSQFSIASPQRPGLYPKVSSLINPQGHTLTPNGSAKASLLSKIISNETGITEYQYEVVDKVRVKSISQKKSAVDANPLVTTYNYGAANFREVPVYHSRYNNYDELYSASRTSFNDLNGVTVGYSYVTIINPDGSKKKLEFTDAADTPAKLYSKDYSESFQSNGPPFSPDSDLSWRRGMINKISLFNPDGNKFYEKNIFYESDKSNLPFAEGRVVTTLFVNSGATPIIGSRYTLQSEKYRIAYENEYTFDFNFPNDASKSLGKNYYYDYNGINQVVKKTSQFIGEGYFLGSYVTEYKYPYDYFLNNTREPLALSIRQLFVDHRLNSLIENQIYFQKLAVKTYVEATVINYKNFTDGSSTILMPWKINRYTNKGESFTSSEYQPSTIGSDGVFRSDPNLVEVQRFNNYEPTNAKPKKAVANGITTDYTWINNGTEVSQVTSSSGLLSSTTNYVNIPFIGPKGITDSNGIITYYKYDKQNRLKLIKNSNDEIVTRYRYNTKENLTGSILTSGAFSVNSNISITGVDPFDYGESSYSWDFGDGTVVENASLSTSHIYTNPGTYTVKLVITNPEYEYLLVTKTIPVYNPVSISMMMLAGDPFIGENLNLCDTPIKHYQAFSVNITGGAPNKTYQWSYTFNAGNPNNFNPLMGLWVSTAGTYEIKCVVTDEYNTSDEITRVISAYDSGCGGPGGGGIY